MADTDDPFLRDDLRAFAAPAPAGTYERMPTRLIARALAELERLDEHNADLQHAGVGHLLRAAELEVENADLRQRLATAEAVRDDYRAALADALPAS